MSRSPSPLPPPAPIRAKFGVRVGEQLHRRRAMNAAQERLGLNRYLVRRLSDVS
ncbi:toxin-antitoxin system HicB family antitoxin [Nostocoides sp.]